MPGPDSHKAFKQAIDERFNALKESLNQAVIALALYGNDETRKKRIKNLSESADHLAELIYSKERPDWLKRLAQISRQYVARGDDQHAQEFVKTLIDIYASVRPIQYVADEYAGVSFDDMFAKYRDEGRLPELFSEAIESITQIIKSGEIDSVTVLDGLRRILAILEGNRNGSLVAIKGCVSASRYVRNLLRVILDKVKGINVFVEAFDRSVAEIDREADAVMQRVRDETLAVIARGMPNEAKVTEFATQAALLECDSAIQVDNGTIEALSLPSPPQE